MLFLLYINGLAEVIKRRRKGVLYGNVKISILLFADDIVLIAENRQDLEFLMQVTYEYSRKWRFNFNYEKSAVVIYSNKKSVKVNVSAGSIGKWEIH